MTSLLLVGLVIFAALLMDTRARLSRAELHIREMSNRQESRFSPDAGQYTDTNSDGLPDAARSVTQPEISDIIANYVADTGASPDAESAQPAREADQPHTVRQGVEDSVAPQPWGEALVENISTDNEPLSRNSSSGFEELFGRKLPIWAGGITLAVAGVLLVKYSIDAGLLSPVVRVILGLMFGAGLIGGAQMALQNRDYIKDDRVHQALAGAGIASLYASVLAAANLYQLVDPGTSFVALVIVTALAIGLSLRFGAPSAVLGLVGGLAAPALVGAKEPNVPLLCTYLVLAMGALAAIARRQRWPWLGAGALVGEAGWGLVLIASGSLDFSSTLSIGMLILLTGFALPLMAIDRKADLALRSGAALIAAAQIAALVATGGFALLNWGMYGLLSAGVIWLAWRDRSLRPLPLIGLVTALFLLVAWPSPPLNQFILVLSSLAILYGVPALLQLWKSTDGIAEAGQVCGIALGTTVLSLLHFYHDSAQDHGFAMIAFGSALLPSLAAVRGWNRGGMATDRRFRYLTVMAAMLMVVAQHFGLPAAWLGIGGAAMVLILAETGAHARTSALVPAMNIFFMLVLLVALEPLIRWTASASWSIHGVAMLATGLPASMSAVQKLLLPALIAGVGFCRLRGILGNRANFSVAVLILPLVAGLHIMYKHMFALGDHGDFVRLGLAERTIWEAMLLVGAIALSKAGRVRTALVVTISGLAHSLWYSLFLHNPLWNEQAVGAWPLVNWLSASYALIMTGTMMLQRLLPAPWRAQMTRPAELVRMGLITLFAYTTLRQLFAGSLLTGIEVGEIENILRSVLAIALAMAFLLWGTRHSARDWRIASLVLMLGAVVKVFLFDASGLTGLLRIASFLALGFSLIGIGWLYSRHLREELR